MLTKKVRLIYGRQYLGGAALERPIINAGNTQRALFLLAGFWDIYASDVRCSISLAVNGLEHVVHPFPEALFCLRHGLAIYPRGRAFWNLTQILYSFPRDMMGQ